MFKQTIQTDSANSWCKQGDKKNKRVETVARRRNGEFGCERGNGMQENLMAIGIQCLLLQKCLLNLGDLLSFLKLFEHLFGYLF